MCQSWNDHVQRACAAWPSLAWESEPYHEWLVEVCGGSERLPLVLPSLDAGKTYQMWQISGQRPVSLGLIRPDGAGHSTAIVPYDPDRPSTLAITIEPAGGSAEPTTAPILTTSPAPSA